MLLYLPIQRMTSAQSQASSHLTDESAEKWGLLCQRLMSQAGGGSAQGVWGAQSWIPICHCWLYKHIGGVAVCCSQFGLFSTGRKSQKGAQLILCSTPLWDFHTVSCQLSQSCMLCQGQNWVSEPWVSTKSAWNVQKHAVARQSILMLFGPGDYTDIEWHVTAKQHHTAARNLQTHTFNLASLLNKGKMKG